MPGLIIEYKVKEGDRVKTGDVLLILEAMKMQNNITAPVAGIVKKIKGTPGTSVPKDSVLCILEAN
jgi:pyruvate carboxylase subunit B